MSGRNLIMSHYTNEDLKRRNTKRERERAGGWEKENSEKVTLTEREVNRKKLESDIERIREQEIEK